MVTPEQAAIVSPWTVNVISRYLQRHYRLTEQESVGYARDALYAAQTNGLREKIRGAMNAEILARMDPRHSPLLNDGPIIDFARRATKMALAEVDVFEFVHPSSKGIGQTPKDVLEDRIYDAALDEPEVVMEYGSSRFRLAINSVMRTILRYLPFTKSQPI